MKGNWFGRHKILTAVIIVIILIAVGSAIGSNGGVNNKASNTPANTPASQASQSKKSNSTNNVAHVGQAIDVGGSKGLHIAMLSVTDPATADNQYITADAGKRFVAVKMQILNNGTGTYKDDANNNVTVIGSDNQSYTADFSGVSGCTNFANGEYTLAAGASATGCVNYQLPNGVNVAKIQFTPDSGFSGSTGEWLNP